jgi:7-cyano-7-deazaguanine synthase in queuosine biosynthesis
MKTVVAFSGGLDSTLVLWKLLTETDEEITAVYLDGQGVDDDIMTSKSEGQFVRAQKVVEELQKIRPFTLIKYTINSEEVTEEIHHKILLFIQYAAPFINDGTYDKLVHCATYEDHHQKLYSHLEYTPTYYAAKRLFDKLCTRGIYSNPLVTDTWYTKYTRAYALKDLPENLKNIVASCVNISYNISTDTYDACGSCSKCLIDKKFKEFLEAGKTPAEILEWKEQKSYEYGDGNTMGSIFRWIHAEVDSPTPITKDMLQTAVSVIGVHHHFQRVKNLNSEGIWKGLFAPE